MNETHQELIYGSMSYSIQLVYYTECVVQYCKLCGVERVAEFFVFAVSH